MLLYVVASLLMFSTHSRQLSNKFRVLPSAHFDVLETLKVVFACCSLEIANVVLHVLKLSVKLFNCFRILPFLVLNLVCVRLNEPFEQLHQIVDVLSFILLLNCGVDHTHEL